MSWLDTLEEIRNTDWGQASDTERQTKAREVVNICSYASSAAAMVPIPIVDLALLLPIHTAMVMTVGHLYGRSISQAEAKRIVLELGTVAGVSFAGTAAISALRRILLPGLGGLLSIPATFALSWGLGRAAIAYFEDPSLSRDDLKKVFEEALSEGKKAFSKDAFDKFRAKDRDEQAPAEETASSQPEDSAPGVDQAPSSPPASSAPSEPADPSLRPKKRNL